MFCNKITPEKCPKFNCNSCDYITSKKSCYDKHLLSTKHIKSIFLNNFESNYAQIMPELCSKFNCNSCHYVTSKKSSYENHLQSIKHKNKQIMPIMPELCPKLCSKFICNLWNLK